MTVCSDLSARGIKHSFYRRQQIGNNAISSLLCASLLIPGYKTDTAQTDYNILHSPSYKSAFMAFLMMYVNSTFTGVELNQSTQMLPSGVVITSEDFLLERLIRWESPCVQTTASLSELAETPDNN